MPIFPGFQSMGRWCIALAVFFCCALLGGCQGASSGKTIASHAQAAELGITHPEPVDSVAAQCAPPIGWLAEPIKSSPKRQHQIWLSPTGSTAYGVIRFSIPLPMSEDLVLPFFIQAMRDSEGQATLLEKSHDPSSGDLLFVAEGGMYKIHSRLIVRGLTGWAIYAASRTGQTPIPAEFHLAELARDYTRTGLNP